MNGERWCIAGGGMLGLSLAKKLALAGERVEIWESSDNLGGLAAPWRLGDVVWDRFYHVITSSDEYLLDLLETLELGAEVRWMSAQTGFFTNGRLHAFSSVTDFVRFPPLNAIDKWRLGTSILRASAIEDGAGLENLTAVEWLTTLSGRRVVELIWLPLLRAKLGVNAERVNASFIWAIIRRMYGARRGRSKRELFGYVPGGYRRILERLADKLYWHGVTTHVGRAVKSITTSSQGYPTVSDGRSSETFDRVIVTAPAPVAAAVCADLLPNERTRLLGIEYQGVICASILLKAPLSRYYITNITDPMPFTAIIEMDALVDRRDLGGRALVYLPKYLASNDPLFEREDDAIRAEFIAALNRIHPRFGMNDVAAFAVSRARHVLPISTIGYSERLPPFKTSLNRVYVVNSSQIVNGTLNVNQTLELSQRAFSEIRSDVKSSVGAGVGCA